MDFHSVFVGGSSRLPGWLATLAGDYARWELSCGRGLITGCAAGADAAVVAKLSRPGWARFLTVYAAGTRAGNGFGRGSSAARRLANAEKLGATIHWSAGGPLSLPLRARLAKRGAAAAVAGHLGFWFVAQPDSTGSIACSSALARAGGIVYWITPAGMEMPDLRVEGKWSKLSPVIAPPLVDCGHPLNVWRFAKPIAPAPIELPNL
jgi:hypothetical protein